MASHLQFISLFAGIGGFDLGLERAGMQCIAQVESDKFCLAVLRRHWPHVPQLEDVRTFTKDSIDDKTVTLICGGFPCQDLSVAGKRAGLAGKRSRLFFNFMRIIAEFTPRWVIIENVPGLLSSNGGRDMGIVTSTLAQLGYGWAYRILNAQFFGVPQRRRRVFIVGYIGNPAPAAAVLFAPESLCRHPAPSRETRRQVTGNTGKSAEVRHVIPFDESQITSPDNHSNPRPGDACHTLHTKMPPTIVNAVTTHMKRWDASTETLVFAWQTAGSDHTQIVRAGDCAGTLSTTRHDAVTNGFVVRRLTPVECERLQGFPDQLD